MFEQKLRVVGAVAIAAALMSIARLTAASGDGRLVTNSVCNEDYGGGCYLEPDLCVEKVCHWYWWPCVGACDYLEGVPTKGGGMCMMCDYAWPEPLPPGLCAGGCYGYPTVVVKYEGRCTKTNGCHCNYLQSSGENFTIYLCAS